MENLKEQWNREADKAAEVFNKKLEDYGNTFYGCRSTTFTDIMHNKAIRMREFERNKVHKVEDEPIQDDLLALINYGVIGIMARTSGLYRSIDDTKECYKVIMTEVLALMLAKNHDYGNTWTILRNSTLTDTIIMKLHRIKHMEGLHLTNVSEGIIPNLQDIINYAIFYLIKLSNIEASQPTEVLE